MWREKVFLVLDFAFAFGVASLGAGSRGGQVEVRSKVFLAVRLHGRQQRPLSQMVALCETDCFGHKKNSKFVFKNFERL